LEEMTNKIKELRKNWEEQKVEIRSEQGNGR
jgi:hypothetical protein